MMEERRLRIDNDVDRRDERGPLPARLRAGPYRWNTVGFMADLKRITLEDGKPTSAPTTRPTTPSSCSPATSIPRPTFALVQRLLRRGFRAGRRPARSMPRSRAQDGERRIVLRMQAELPAVLPRLPCRPGHRRRSAGARRRRAAPGRTARARGSTATWSAQHEVATGVYADLEWGIDPELFGVYAQARPGKTAADMIARIDAVVASLATAGPGTEELTQGQAPAARRAREGPQDRQRQGEQARLLRGGLRRLPRHVRSRGGVGRGHCRGRPARRHDLSRAGAADDRHPRAARPPRARRDERRCVVVALVLGLSSAGPCRGRAQAAAGDAHDARERAPSRGRRVPRAAAGRDVRRSSARARRRIRPARRGWRR